MPSKSNSKRAISTNKSSSAKSRKSNLLLEEKIISLETLGLIVKDIQGGGKLNTCPSFYLSITNLCLRSLSFSIVFWPNLWQSRQTSRNPSKSSRLHAQRLRSQMERFHSRRSWGWIQEVSTHQPEKKCGIFLRRKNTLANREGKNCGI